MQTSLSMKRQLLPYIVSVLLSAACSDRLSEMQEVPDIPGTVSAEEAYVPGVFRVKVSETSPALDTKVFTRSGGSGSEEFDRAAVQAGAVSISRVFSDGGRFMERRRRAGLHRWYDVRFSEDITVAEAISRFGNPENVVCVEPVYRMVQTAAVISEAHTYMPLDMSVPPFDDPLHFNQWFMHNEGSLPYSAAGADINVYPAWTVGTGRDDVIVAICDGGIDYTHPDLAPNMWDDGEGHCGYNFNRHSYDITPSDHGTHVAGIVAAVSNNGIGVCGIAGGDGSDGSGVKLMSCQVFDDEGYADIFDIMTWSADHGAVISQNSWSYTGATDLSQSGKDAIDYFIRNAGCDENGRQTGPMKGGVVIFAAGNDGTDTPKYPAAYGPVIAVASLGPDFRKAYSSNYGDWIDIAAPGGEIGDSRLGVYSTFPGGKYGFASGTSMACPQVSGIAALAVSEFGGPGFTNDDLVSLLLESGRRELTETMNPQYAGQLGNGLIDAGYIFFRDAVPDPVTDVTATGRRCRIEMQWKAPMDYKGDPLVSYGVYVSGTPFSASSADEIPASAVRYDPEVTLSEDGRTVSCHVDGLDTDTEYCIAIVGLSPGGMASAPYVFQAKTSDSAPEAVREISDIYLAAGDKDGVSVPLDDCFTDADMPDDRLSYFASFPDGDIVEGRVTDGSVLRLIPLGTGSVTVTVIAADLDGMTAGIPVRIIVGAAGADIDVYPNPCTDVLNIRIPGADGDFPVRIYDVSGGLVLSGTVSVGWSGKDSGACLSDSPTGALDVGSLAPGRYVCEVDYFGSVVSARIIKR